MNRIPLMGKARQSHNFHRCWCVSGYEHRASCDNCKGMKTRVLTRVTLLGRWSEVGGAGEAEDREKKEIKLHSRNTGVT